MLIYLVISALFFSIIFLTGILTFPSINLENKDESKILVPIYFFWGLILFTVFSGYLTLFSPIKNYFVLVCLGLILVAVVIFKNRLLVRLKNFDTPSKIDIKVFAVLAIFISLVSATGIYNYDSGLYHIQAIKWINAYPVVPGLGIFHDRFAFNSMLFPVSALFSANNFIMGGELVLYPINAISFTVYLYWQYQNLKNYYKNKDFNALGMIIPIIFLSLIYLLKNTSSPSPDLICAIGTIMILQILLSEDKIRKNQKIFLASFIFLLFVFKLSTVFLLLAIPLYLISSKHWIKDLFLFATIAAVICAPFLIRNYYLSGYLIYPFPGIDLFNPDWKIPQADANHTKQIIQSWARIPRMNYQEVLSLPFREWLPVWYIRQDILMKLVLIPTLLLPFFWFVFYLFKTSVSSKLLFLIICNTIFWIYTPDPRFFYGFLFFSFGYSLSLSLEILSRKLSQIWAIRFVKFTLILFALAFVIKQRKILNIYIQDMGIFLVPTTYTMDTDLPKFNTGQENFIYYWPSSGDQCYNQKLPCTTTRLDTNVVLRGQSLADGFKIIK